jgi:hypothetical protein
MGSANISEVSEDEKPVIKKAEAKRAVAKPTIIDSDSDDGEPQMRALWSAPT